MVAALYVLFVLDCLFLIMVVLLQAGKGDGMGAAFGGGGSDTVFGTRGAATFLSKLTVGSAFLFMALSIILAFFSSNPASRVGGGYVDPNEVSGAIGQTLGSTGEQEGTGILPEEPFSEPFEWEMPLPEQPETEVPTPPEQPEIEPPTAPEQPETGEPAALEIPTGENEPETPTGEAQPQESPSTEIVAPVEPTPLQPSEVEPPIGEPLPVQPAEDRPTPQPTDQAVEPPEEASSAGQ